MRMHLLALATALSLFALPAVATAQDTTSDKGKVSYAIGFEIGSDFVNKKMEVDVATVIRGIQDGVAKRPPTVPPEQMRAALEKMREKLMAEAKAQYEQLARGNLGAAEAARAALEKAVRLTRAGFGPRHSHTRRAEISLARLQAQLAPSALKRAAA